MQRSDVQKLCITGSVLVLFVALGTGFNFGVTPAKAEEGVKNPGDRFFASFFVITEEDEEMAVTIRTEDGGIGEFQQLREEDVENFSEQRCEDCVDFLKAGGPLEEHEQGGSVERLKAVEFFVNVPDDIEPGYHMLNVLPRPQRGGGGGGVGVLSSASFPVIFRVPGAAIRSGRILGTHAGKNVDGRQSIVSTFYNDGTVTVTAESKITVADGNGNRTLYAGADRIAPGEAHDFSASVDLNTVQLQNDTFDVYTTVDYRTGTAAYNTALEPRAPVTRASGSGAVTQKPSVTQPSLLYYIGLLLLISLTTLVTWKVVNHARY